MQHFNHNKEDSQVQQPNSLEVDTPKESELLSVYVSEYSEMDNNQMNIPNPEETIEVHAVNDLSPQKVLD